MQPQHSDIPRRSASLFRFLVLSTAVAAGAAACSSAPSTSTVEADGGTDRYLEACLDLCNKEVDCGMVSTDCDSLCKTAEQTIDPKSCTNADAIVAASRVCVAAACTDLIACEDQIPKCEMAAR